MDLINEDYLWHTDFEPWGDDRNSLFAGQGDVPRAPSDAERAAFDVQDDDGYEWGRS